jgi:hypothetical protein
MQTTKAQSAGLVPPKAAGATEGLVASVAMEGTRRILTAELTVHAPKPGVIFDGAKVLNPLMKGDAPIDEARVVVNVTGLAEGQKYDLASVVGLAGKRIALKIDTNLDRVPKDTLVQCLHLADNRAPLSEVKLGGNVGDVWGTLTQVAYDTMYV